VNSAFLSSSLRWVSKVLRTPDGTAAATALRDVRAGLPERALQGDAPPTRRFVARGPETSIPSIGDQSKCPGAAAEGETEPADAYAYAYAYA